MPIDGIGNKQLATLYATVFVDSVGFGLSVPLIPYYAMNFGATSLDLALMTTAFNFGALFGNMLLCSLSDRIGRKPVICICLVASCACYVALAVAFSIHELMLLRLLLGFFSGTVACAKVYVADCTDEQERPKYIGNVNLCLACSVLAGPALGGLCALVSIAFAFQLFAVVCFLNAICGFTLLVEPPRQQPKITGAVVEKTGIVEAVKAQPGIFVIILSCGMQYLAFSPYEALGAEMLLVQYKIGTSEFSILQVVFGVVYVLTMKVGFVRLYNTMGGKRTAQIGHIFRCIGYVLLGYGSHWIIAMLALICFGLGGLITPANDTTLSILATPSSRGGVQGANTAVAAFVRTVGPLAAVPLFNVYHGLPFFVSAGLMAFSTLVLSFLQDPWDSPRPWNVMEELKSPGELESRARPNILGSLPVADPGNVYPWDPHKVIRRSNSAIDARQMLLEPLCSGASVQRRQTM